MTRYRIVQRPSVSEPGQAIFEVEEHCFLGWEYRGLELSLEAAESRVAKLMTCQPVKVKVVKEYN